MTNGTHLVKTITSQYLILSHTIKKGNLYIIRHLNIMYWCVVIPTEHQNMSAY